MIFNSDFFRDGIPKGASTNTTSIITEARRYTHRKF